MAKKYNVLVDLDNTLISSLSRKEEKKSHAGKFKKFVWENMDGQFKVFQRPGLQEFLDFLFKNFNVSVWTAASKSYALFIIDNFILIKPERKLDHVFFSYHCCESIKKRDSQKDLKMLWTKFNLGDIYGIENTFIIDDHPEVYETQPTKCIRVYPFEFLDKKSFQDSELLQTVKPKLEKILRSEHKMG